jgi:hypothetical protein
MAAKLNINLDQGSSFIYSINLIDSGGIPIDITDYYGNGVMATSYTSPTKFPMDITIEGSNGVITMSMNSATTSALTSSRYIYDVILTNNTSGIVSRIAEGTVTVSPSIVF